MDEEEQVRRAIELSLQDADTKPTRRLVKRPEEEDADEEEQFERDLAAAIEASKVDARVEVEVNRGSGPSPPASRLPGALTNEITEEEEEEEEEEEKERPSFLSERAKMEKERLGRIERMKKGAGSSVGTGVKRGREDGSDAASSSGAGDSKANANANSRYNGAVSPPTKKQRSSPSPPTINVRTNGTGTKKNGKEQGKGKENEGKYELFWEGEIRQIANRLVDRDKDVRPTFRLSEIVGPKCEVTLAILSSYANSMDWLYTFFEPTTPIVVVNQPGEDGNSGLKALAPNLMMTKPFIRNGRGCMHIKLMLLFYKDGRLRVVVPTANLIEYDWRDIENTAWVQDIPMRHTTIRHDPKASDFPGTLQRTLHSLNVPAALNKFLDGEEFSELPIEALSELRMRWDWSKVRVKLVVSIAGRHEGWDKVGRTGHPALMGAVKELGASPQKGKEVVLECQGSSVGTYSTQWMNEFYCSARGESARVWLDNPRSQRAKLSWPPVKILFPSLQTVKDSVLGMPGGGTMFCRKAQWEAKNFPRELFYDSNSKRGRVLMHSKMIVATFRDRDTSLGSASTAFGVSGKRAADQRGVGAGGKNDNHEKNEVGDDEGDGVLSGGKGTNNRNEGYGEEKKEEVIGWAYVGSHNFTPSAWGTLSGSAASPSLNIVNYELGIVIPLQTCEELERVACWKRPARKYVRGVDRPWMQEEMKGGLAVMED